MMNSTWKPANTPPSRSDKPWVRHWAKVAAHYDEKVRFVVGTATYDALRQKLLAEGPLGDVLELGCGTGQYTRILAQTAAQVTATDLGEEMLSVARTRLAEQRNVRFERADAEAPPYADERFGTVFMANVFAALDAPKTLRACFRLLKPGGRLLIVNLTFRMPLLAYLVFGLRSLLAFGIPPRGRRDPLPQELAQWASDVGFQVESAELVGSGVKAVYVRARKARGGR